VLGSLQAVQHLVDLESSLPEGTRVELQLHCSGITVPGVGKHLLAAQIASALAWLVNNAAALEQRVGERFGMGILQPWPGYPLAEWNRYGDVAIRWVKRAPGLPVIVGFLAGLGLFVSRVVPILPELATPEGIAAAVGALAAALVAGIAVFALISLFQFVAFVVEHPEQALPALGQLGKDIVVVGIVATLLVWGTVELLRS